MKHEPKPPRRKLRYMGPIIRRHPAVFAVYLVLRLIVIAVLVSSILRREYESAFICLLVLVLFMLPFFIQQNHSIPISGNTNCNYVFSRYLCFFQNRFYHFNICFPYIFHITLCKTRFRYIHRYLCT